MKNILKRMTSKKFWGGALLTLVAVVSLGTIGAALIGGDRPTKVYNGPGTEGFNHVTFNSFTNVPNIGDERNYFTGKIAGAPGGFYDPMNGVRSGDEILMRVYVHNNADTKYNTAAEGYKGIARNTRVRVQLPDGTAQNQTASAFVSADNAQPQMIEDTLSLTGETPVALEYVPGSATIKSNQQDRALSDELVTNGVKIGDDNINGDMNGCFEYIALVTFKVKVKGPSYSVEKSVRKVGGTPSDWKKSYEAEPGETVEWRVEYKNIGATETKSVKIVDPIDEKLDVVAGSVRLYNGNYPDGYTYPSNAVQMNGRQINIDIGNYAPGINAYVYFKTKVADAEELECGVNTIKNQVYATPTGTGTVTSTAQVVTERPCAPTNPTYECKLINVEKLGGRKVNVKVTPASTGNVTVNSYEYNFGDGSEVLVTDKDSAMYTYKKDGTYNIAVSINFTVDGEEKTGVTSVACEQIVKFKSGKPATPETPSTPATLTNTGSGEVIGLFLATAIASAVAYQLVWARRYQ